MTDQNEKLAHLLDDHEAEDAATIDEIIGDVNLQYCARRYRMIGETMRNEMPSAIDTGFHSSVMARIQEESGALPDNSVPQVEAPRLSIFGWLSLKPLAGMAVAVAVAMVTVTWWQQESAQDDRIVADAEEEKIQQLVQQQAQGGAVPVSTRVQDLGTRWNIQHDMPGMQQKLNAYLVNHTEQAGSMQGLIPQARVAGFDTQK